MGSCAFETGVKEGTVVEPGNRAKGSKEGEHSFGGGLTYKKDVSAATTPAPDGGGSGSGGDGPREVKEEHKGTAVLNIMGGA